MTTKPTSIRDEITSISSKIPASKPNQLLQDSVYDIDGLKTDFPTATELQKFVFDTTGISLNLKGRKNDVKYSVALAALTGNPVPSEFLTDNNPYVDKNDLVPVDEIGSPPPRSLDLPAANTLVSHFSSSMVPHPDPECAAGDQKCDIVFRKYSNNVISYEIIGPVNRIEIGSKIDKYGRTRPERIGWIDPRTGEQVLRTATGEYTKFGRGLKLFLEGRSLWYWVDRDFYAVEQEKIINPWS